MASQRVLLLSCLLYAASSASSIDAAARRNRNAVPPPLVPSLHRRDSVVGVDSHDYEPHRQREHHDLRSNHDSERDGAGLHGSKSAKKEAKQSKAKSAKSNYSHTNVDNIDTKAGKEAKSSKAIAVAVFESAKHDKEAKSSKTVSVEIDKDVHSTSPASVLPPRDFPVVGNHVSHVYINISSALDSIGSNDGYSSAASNDGNDNAFISTVNTPITIDVTTSNNETGSSSSSILEVTNITFNASNGTCVIIANENGESSSIAYTPNEGFMGDDTCGYLVCGTGGENKEGGWCEEALLEVKVILEETVGSSTSNDGSYTEEEEGDNANGSNPNNSQPTKRPSRRPNDISGPGSTTTSNNGMVNSDDNSVTTDDSDTNNAQPPTATGVEVKTTPVNNSNSCHETANLSRTISLLTLFGMFVFSR